MALTALAFAFAGFGALAAAMPRHQRDLFAKPPGPRATQALSTAGWTLIAAALALSVTVRGIGVGLAAAAGLLTVAALITALLVTYRPRALARTAATALGCALLSLPATGLAAAANPTTQDPAT